MAAVTHPLEAVTGGLRNEDTEKKLDFIEELHNLGVSKYIDLPQLVVVGDQSSGKSSVLQAITKLPFPVSDTMCTRFATEVALHRYPGPTSMKFTVKPSNTIHVNGRDVHHQRMRDWQPASLTNIDELDEQTLAQQFSALLKEGSKVILDSETDIQSLSDATLHISFRSPKGINLTVVDIPGLVTVGHAAHHSARNLVEYYIRNPKSIILAVVHPGDPGTQEVFQILKNIPKKETRVIGAITKCDRKQEGAEDWILDTIRNERVRSNPHFLAQGWFGLRNRLPREARTSNEERDIAEAAFFAEGIWKDLDRPAKLGINNMRNALTKMLNTHITESIPELIPEIKQQLAVCKSKLEALGRPRNTKAAQLDCMVNLASNFHKLSTYALDGHYDRLPDLPNIKVRKLVQENLENFQCDMQYESRKYFPAEESFELNDFFDQDKWAEQILTVAQYQEIEEVIKSNRGKESPGQVNPCVLSILWRSKTVRWMEAASDVIDHLLSSISLAVKIIFEDICKDEDLRKNTQQWLSENLNRVSRSAQSELKRLHADECKGMIWTLNPKFTEHIQKSSDAHFEHLVSQLVTLVQGESHDRRSISKNVKIWLGKRKDISAVFDTYDRLAAYYSVAMHRFIDNFGHQVIERHLLGPNSPLCILQPSYVVRMLQEDDETLQRLAGENRDKMAERTALDSEKVSLENALSTARNYGFCGN